MKVHRGIAAYVIAIIALSIVVHCVGTIFESKITIYYKIFVFENNHFMTL